MYWNVKYSLLYTAFIWDINFAMKFHFNDENGMTLALNALVFNSFCCFSFCNLEYRLGWREDTNQFSLREVCARGSWLACRSQRFWKEGLSALLIVPLPLLPFVKILLSSVCCLWDQQIIKVGSQYHWV